MGACFLARVGALNNKKEALAVAKAAATYTCARQRAVPGRLPSGGRRRCLIAGVVSTWRAETPITLPFLRRPVDPIGSLAVSPGQEFAELPYRWLEFSADKSSKPTIVPPGLSIGLIQRVLNHPHNSLELRTLLSSTTGMAHPHPTALRERAVREYEDNTDTYAEVAAQFAIGKATLVRWVSVPGRPGRSPRSPTRAAGARRLT
jgi:hypothetical protein